jgi:hypothetical protein
LTSVCSCVLFTVIIGISILFPVAWAYVIFDRPSLFSGTAGFYFSCPGVFVVRILNCYSG